MVGDDKIPSRAQENLHAKYVGLGLITFLNRQIVFSLIMLCQTEVFQIFAWLSYKFLEKYTTIYKVLSAFV